MRTLWLPDPRDMTPNTRWVARCGSVIALHPGKHGDKDVRVELNGAPVSFHALALCIEALYVAEERYDGPRHMGGDYLVANMSAWIYWARTHLDKPPRTQPFYGPFCV